MSVFYDPKDPSEAVLEPGAAAATRSLEVGLLLVGLVVVFGAVIIVQSVRRLRAARVLG